MKFETRMKLTKAFDICKAVIFCYSLILIFVCSFHILFYGCNFTIIKTILGG